MLSIVCREIGEHELFPAHATKAYGRAASV